ncbi:glycerol-3-phosphate 1-O-acyltransferase PlsY [Desulfatitalea alkaliphila]|uniref:Glycerol-3-phosphate acyltransferase n=1 Tax=Desulfatitalea alkaliphila TaxID=2929485 RepID=A0AA41ULB3_9BACT|nr:glycerol-3-phosphate 1-O-acyltransferase PlsY [Desulfatitalea alkaliphila]MCJ8501316.1 glycerol-3-phosphate 1-O-acyltransferase PlsY [Desulfatitalea alkaliphila]
MNLSIWTLLLPMVAYLIGGIPVGLLLVRWTTRLDVRQTGSGNIGTTNVWRVAGMGVALATLSGDILKGALPCLATLHLVDHGPAYPASVGVAAVLGHMFPIYLGFRTGGKGVATAAGMFGVLTPLACGLALAVFFLSAVISRRVSVGSLVGALALPVLIVLTSGDLYLAGAGTLVMLLMMLRHRDNIQRLRKGEEPEFKGKR